MNNNTKKIVRKKLLSMMLPTISGMIVTFLFQLVDTYFIGKLGVDELAAISFTYPVYFAIVSIFMGLGVGVGASVGKAYGEDNRSNLKKLTSMSIVLTIVLALLVSLVGLMTKDYIFIALGAPESLIPRINEYISIILFGIVFLVVSLNAIAALRAKGRTLIPELAMAFGGLVNLVLDYVFIFGNKYVPAMGLKGAAIATVLSWIVVLIIIFIILIRDKLLTFRISKVDVITSLKAILKVGIPAMGIQLISPISIAIITKFIASNGANAIAAFGIITKVESLGLTTVIALSVVLVPLSAQQFGAKQEEQFDNTVALSGKLTVYWGITLFALLLIFSKNIANIFTDSVSVVDIVRNYFSILGISYPLYGITLISASLFNGAQEAKKALKLIVVKYFIMLIPALFIGSIFGINGIWVSLSLVNVFGGVYASKLFRNWLKNQNSSIANVNIVKAYIKDIKSLFIKNR